MLCYPLIKVRRGTTHLVERRQVGSLGKTKEGWRGRRWREGKAEDRGRRREGEGEDGGRRREGEGEDGGRQREGEGEGKDEGMNTKAD